MKEEKRVWKGITLEGPKTKEKVYVSVDNFCKKADVYFLSHFHSDHYTGLTQNWEKGPIFASKTTLNLLKHKFNLKSELLFALEDKLYDSSFSLFSPNSKSKQEQPEQQEQPIFSTPNPINESSFPPNLFSFHLKKRVLFFNQKQVSFFSNSKSETKEKRENGKERKNGELFSIQALKFSLFNKKTKREQIMDIIKNSSSANAGEEKEEFAEKEEVREEVREEVIEFGVNILEANHCSGAVMLLFSLPQSSTPIHNPQHQQKKEERSTIENEERKQLLYTGDFRYCEEELEEREKRKYKQLLFHPNSSFHQVFLDTTFCDPLWNNFPTKTQSSLTFSLFLSSNLTPPLNSSSSTLQISVRERKSKEVQVLVEMGMFGLEDLIVYLSKFFGKKLSVSKERFEKYKLIPTLFDYVTTDFHQTNLHVIDKNQLQLFYIQELSKLVEEREKEAYNLRENEEGGAEEVEGGGRGKEGGGESLVWKRKKFVLGEREKFLFGCKHKILSCASTQWFGRSNFDFRKNCFEPIKDTFGVFHLFYSNKSSLFLFLFSSSLLSISISFLFSFFSFFSFSSWLFVFKVVIC